MYSFGHRLLWLYLCAGRLLHGHIPIAAGFDSACPFDQVRVTLNAFLNAVDGDAGHKDQISALLHSGDDGLLKLCCDGGWLGDGTLSSGGPRDGGLCWNREHLDFTAFARCCYGEVRSLAQAPAPEWMRDEIASDFSAWLTSSNARRFSERELDSMEQDWGHVYCRFRIRSGVLSTCDLGTIEDLRDDKSRTGESYGQFESMARATRILLANDLLPSRLDFFVSPHLYDFIDVPLPVLSKARVAFSSSFVRVPSYELVGPLLDRVRRQLSPVPWHEKAPTLFWRGGMRSFNSCPCHSGGASWPLSWRGFNLSRLLASNHPSQGGCYDLPASVCSRLAPLHGHCRCYRHITNRTNLGWSNRARLCELSLAHPHLIDAKLTYVPLPTYASVVDELEERGHVTSFSRMEDHAHHRYLMSTDGSTIDDTRVYWMLSSGSVVFKQLTPLLPFGLPGLRPWEHFVPVREDLGDLVAKVRWARQNDRACKEMARRAGAFANEYFTQRQIIYYIYLVLSQYADLVEPG